MSITTVKSRIEQEDGPVRQDGARLITSHRILEKLASNLRAHQTFQDSDAQNRASVLVGGASIVAEEPSPGAHVSRPARWRELEWMKNHPEQVDAYRGQWVIVTTSGIAAASPTGAGLPEAARRLGIAVPFVLWIPQANAAAEIT